MLIQVNMLDTTTGSERRFVTLTSWFESSEFSGEKDNICHYFVEKVSPLTFINNYKSNITTVDVIYLLESGDPSY